MRSELSEREICVRLCMWASGALRGACAESMRALFEALAPRLCVHVHSSRRLSREYIHMCALNYVDGCVRLSIWVDALRGLEIFGLKLDY